MQPDTIIPGAGNPIAWDRYAYAMNNPLKFIDPTGHLAIKGPFGGGGKIPGGGTQGTTTQQPTLTTSNNYERNASVMVVLLCGTGGNGSCTNRNPDLTRDYEGHYALQHLDEYLQEAGIQIIIRDTPVKYQTAEEVYELLQIYNYDQLVIVGFSSGGDAAAVLVDMLGYPDSISGVVLLDPSGNYSSPNGVLSTYDLIDTIIEYEIPLSIIESNYLRGPQYSDYEDDIQRYIYQRNINVHTFLSYDLGTTAYVYNFIQEILR